MMNRLECWRILARHITDEIVVAAYSSATDWMAVADRPLNYFAVGAMGLASSHALGLALAMPERRVVVLDGDGSLCMNLGTLVTIAAADPKNLTHVVAQNGTYEANGGHPLPNPRVDFVAMARAAGMRSCHTFTNVAAFEGSIVAMLAEQGPVFAALQIEQGPISVRDYSDMYSAARRAAFRAALNASHERSGGL